MQAAGTTTVTQALRTFGDGMARLRLEHNLTQRALADLSGVAYSTLRRIEREGEGSLHDVAAILAALGRDELLARTFAGARPNRRARAAPRDRIRIADYPFLRLIAWSRDANSYLDPHEALALYERNWRHVRQDELTPAERALIKRLVAETGNGVLHV